MKVSVRFSSFIFVCLCSFLKKHKLKLALKDVFNNHLFQSFWKGWMVVVMSLVRLLYDFIPDNFFPALPTDFLITEYDDRCVRYMNRLLPVILFSQNGRFIYSVYRLSFSIFPGWQAQIILNVHTTVALVRNGIELSIKLSLFYNFHSFVFIAKTSGLLKLLFHRSYLWTWNHYLQN